MHVRKINFHIFKNISLILSLVICQTMKIFSKWILEKNPLDLFTSSLSHLLYEYFILVT